MGVCPVALDVKESDFDVASYANIEAISEVSWRVVFASAVDERSCEILAIRTGCVETWTFDVDDMTL